MEDTEDDFRDICIHSKNKKGEFKVKTVCVSPWILLMSPKSDSLPCLYPDMRHCGLELHELGVHTCQFTDGSDSLSVSMCVFWMQRPKWTRKYPDEAPSL